MAASIRSLLVFNKGLRTRLMEYAHLAVDSDRKLAALIEDWRLMKPALRKTLDLDLLCEAHGIDPAHFIAVAGEAGLRLRNDASILIAAVNMPAVIAASVKRALEPEGTRDRRMLFEFTGFIPVAKSRGLRTAATKDHPRSEKISKGLQSFEGTMRLLEELEDPKS